VDSELFSSDSNFLVVPDPDPTLKTRPTKKIENLNCTMYIMGLLQDSNHFSDLWGKYVCNQRRIRPFRRKLANHLLIFQSSNVVL
jgi:hypothetical protein